MSEVQNVSSPQSKARKIFNTMRLIASKILFYCGDTLSNFLYFEWMGAVLYPIYKKLMLWSSELDKDGVIWKKIEE